MRHVKFAFPDDVDAKRFVVGEGSRGAEHREGRPDEGSLAAHPRSSIRSPSALSSERVFEDLNPEQQQAVLHGEGPLPTVAGAGSGKTPTLAARVARRIERGTRPERSS